MELTELSPRLSVVIPTYNRRALLSLCLDSVFDQDCDSNLYEVIVIVDGSEDDTADMLSSKMPACGLRYIVQKNAGQAAARNQGIRAAQGRLILFLDDDILVPRNFISSHVAAHTSGDSIVAFGAVYVSPSSQRGLATSYTDSFSRIYYGELEDGGEIRYPEHIHVLPNSSIPRSALLELNGFDERFFRAHEDTELGIRLWKKQFRFVFLRGVACMQVFGKRAVDVGVLEAELDGRSEVLLCEKHKDYRHFSDLVPLPQVQHLLEEAALRFPYTGEISSAILQMSEPLSGSRIGSRIGHRLMSYSRRATLHRASCAALGGTEVLREHFWKRLPVLMYHHVGPERGLGPHTVGTEEFARQMEWLRNAGFESVSPAQWRAWCEDGRQLPAKPVILTFDDGFSDLEQHAFPVLERLGLTATVFLVTREIGGTNEWDRVKGMRETRLLDADQIRNWVRRGIEFGAHTRTHRDLSKCDGDELVQEIVGSADDLESLTGARPSSFAYPYGIFTPEAKAIVAATYSTGFSVENGRSHLGTDYYMLKRTMVLGSDSRVAFLSRLRIGCSPLDVLRRIIPVTRDRGNREPSYVGETL